MDNHELKALINTQPDTRPFQIGDRVRIVRGPTHEQDGIYYTSDMKRMQGQEHIVINTWGRQQRVRLDGLNWTWIPAWLERV